MITHSQISRGREIEITGVFLESFTDSEGEEEGAVVASLAEELMRSTPEAHLRIHLALDGTGIAGAIMFSRLWFDGDPRLVFLLSPVAVLPEWQGKGVGTGLLNYGLGVLADEGVDVVMSYGDPRYYGRAGFQPVSPQVVPPPMPLSMPQGWIGQPLTSHRIEPFSGPSRCVAAFRRPALW